MTHSHASRPFSTDGMVEAVCARHPRTAIDLGCGEGWLVRALASQHIDVLGIDAVQALLRAIPGLPVPDGALIVQTLHPLACADSSYHDGWREGSWDGCGDGFGAAAPRYFRTLGGGVACLAGAGLQLVQLIEPVHPHSVRPASMILVAEVA